MTHLRLNPRRPDDGFTLIELLVVIVIIGILAGIAIPMFLSQREKAVESALRSDLKSAATLQETFYVGHGEYAATVGELEKFTETKGNTVAVTLTSDPVGYCLRASNPAAPAPRFYDSNGGGLLPAGETC